MILNLYKNIGETPLERINRFRKENLIYKGEKMTYAGRLDPIAEGLLLVLVGDAVHEKEKYLKFDKEYEFELIFGVRTDTYDVLGLIQNISNLEEAQIDKEKILSFLKTKTKKFLQKYPNFSSKTVGGIPLWKRTKDANIDNENIPEKLVEIYKIDFLVMEQISSDILLKRVLNVVSSVNGDFRQAEITKSWIENTKNIEKFFIAKMKMSASSGVYVRSFINELGEFIGVGAVTLSIKRTRVGEFRIVT